MFRLRPFLLSSPAVAAFSPADMAVLDAWYAAGDWDVAYGPIGQWNDSSGNGDHLTQATGASQPFGLPYDGDSYLWSPGVNGNNASAPDNDSWTLDGDVEIVLRMAMDDWTPAGATVLVAHYTGSGNQRGWYLAMDASARFHWRQSPDGLGTAEEVATGGVLPLTNETYYWLKFTKVKSTGAVEGFYHADQAAEPTSGWTSVGSVSSLSAALATHNSTEPLFIAGLTSTLATAGRVKRVIIKDEIGGSSPLLDCDFTAVSDLATSFTAGGSVAPTITINNGTPATPCIVNGKSRAMFDGSDDWLGDSTGARAQPRSIYARLVRLDNADHIWNTYDSNTMSLVNIDDDSLVIAAGANLQLDGNSLNANMSVAAVYNNTSSVLQVSGVGSAEGNVSTGNGTGFALGCAGGAFIGTICAAIGVTELFESGEADDASVRTSALAYLDSL